VAVASLLGVRAAAAAAGGGVVPPALAAGLLIAGRLVAVSCGAWSAVFWEQVVFSRRGRDRARPCARILLSLSRVRCSARVPSR
jgi:hypothetical protein